MLDLSTALRRSERNTLGAKTAVARFFGQRLQKSKKITTTNWALPRLSEKQILYAADDAHVALRVYRRWRAGQLSVRGAASSRSPSPAPPCRLLAERPGARLPDTMEQRLLACTSCHARPDRNDAFFPRISGKPAGYLYNQLVNFKTGARQFPMMTYMVSHLPDAYLREIAGHFAAQHLPPLPPAQPRRWRRPCWNAAACWPCRATAPPRSRPASPATARR